MSLSDHYQRTTLPKPEPRKRVKARKDREDAKQLKAFRDAVWTRQQTSFLGVVQYARCQRCGAVVSRGFGILSGDVHHRIGRGAKTTRYDPDNGVLLCNSLVNDCHGKVQRHEVECP